MEALEEVPEHEHSLKLIDLQLEYPHYEEEEDDDDDNDGDSIKREVFFEVACDMCGRVISMYHRYYYKCMIYSSCHLSLHKFCAELPPMLESPFDQHPLSMYRMCHLDWACSICNNEHKRGELCYRCYLCFFYIDVNCAVELGKTIIHHPCHPHSLICAISQPILCNCKACGKEHKGVFYQCTACVGFTIHHDCAFLPKTLLIQHTTNDAFNHTHPLTISYSFPRKYQEAKHYPRCRVCGYRFYERWYLWIYKCDKCMYYAHVDCATSRREPFMSIFLSAGFGKTIKNFKDIDHPHLLHLPFPDETYSIPKHLFFQESGGSTTQASEKIKSKHISHQHPLILVDQTQCNVQMIDSWLSMCHNPMKKTKLLCNGCLRPIMSTMPFYKCAQSCNFALHEWCTRLPQKIENYPGHPQHTLALMYSNDLPFFFGVFDCDVCRLPCNGFAYCCVECGYYIDVTCGFIHKQITHKVHPNHLLSIIHIRSLDGYCHICLLPFLWGPSKLNHLYNCNLCDIYIHSVCALSLVETVRHKHDKHPMHLSYLPIENHKSEYFCEICENDLNPHVSFYHCQVCVQSVHAACAPSILQTETETYSRYRRGIHYFMNIKFGGIHNIDSHSHPLSFAQGIVSDGKCSVCGKELQCKMIFKCLRCRFVIDYKCCKRMNNI